MVMVLIAAAAAFFTFPEHFGLYRNQIDAESETISNQLSFLEKI